MRTVGLYVLLAATPAVAFWAAICVLDRVMLGRPLRRRPRRGPDVPSPASRPLGRLVEDLRRLEGEYRRIERADEPGRARRLRAVGLAYDDTLRACCRTVGLPEPSDPPLSAITRLETEAALAQSGVTW